MAQTKPALDHPWRLLTLLVVSIFINFIDRSNLSVAAADLRRELMLDHSQLGLLLSAFFCSYAAFQLLPMPAQRDYTMFAWQTSANAICSP